MKDIIIQVRKLTEKEKELNKSYINSFYYSHPQVYHITVDGITFIGYSATTIESIIDYYKKKSGSL